MARIDTTKKDDDVPEPVIMAIAGCKQDTVAIKLGEDGVYQEVNKNDFGIFVVVFDFLVVVILIIFVGMLDRRQKAYAEKFQDETIEMSDFCIRFSGMPKNEHFSGKETVLKAKLWNTMTEVIVDQALHENKIGAVTLEEFEKPDYQLADINFAEKDIGLTKILYDLS